MYSAASRVEKATSPGVGNKRPLIPLRRRRGPSDTCTTVVGTRHDVIRPDVCAANGSAGKCLNTFGSTFAGDKGHSLQERRWLLRTFRPHSWQSGRRHRFHHSATERTVEFSYGVGSREGKNHRRWLQLNCFAGTTPGFFASPGR